MRFTVFIPRHTTAFPPPPHRQHLRTLFDGDFTLVRDRGLDHAVEREKNLKPLLNLRNLIKHEPSKLTPEAVELDAEEGFMYNSQMFKQQVADRLLKLLMISKIHKIPLRVIEGLRWDLGLPQDYAKSMILEFPDYFRVIGTGGDAVLELVCWSKELAVSLLEKKMGSKGKILAFPMQFSTGFKMDNNDESDRWVVGVLHEILHLLVSKKTDKDNVLVLGEWLGLASRFKRAVLQHPGIFYLSSKNRTYTVVLREGYKRGLLVEDNQAMEFRRKYIHLMNTVKEDSKKQKDVKGKSSAKEGNVKDCEGKEGEEKRGSDENREEEQEEEGSSELSDSEAEDASETVVDDDEEESSRGNRRSSANRRGRNFVEMKLGDKKPSRDSVRERPGGKISRKTWEKNPSKGSKRIQTRGEYKDVRSSPQRSRLSKSRERSFTKNTV
ncbi:unnamed protein product [Vicia faba]|uniref:PORR domain-containing protein n=1 Tax=Vicia faba TaxID=3906 RepID=A0AAV1AX21_VICFA|nr:unnamed protein product [Vicia faba]